MADKSMSLPVLYGETRLLLPSNQTPHKSALNPRYMPALYLKCTHPFPKRKEQFMLKMTRALNPTDTVRTAIEQLTNSDDYIEVVDYAGNTVGHFVPVGTIQMIEDMEEELDSLPG